jgi:hypothetical protein
MNAVDFVIAAAHFGAGGRPELPAAPDSPALWRRVVDLAIEHRVAPLLWEALSRAPEAAASTANAGVRQALLEQLMRSQATRMLCEETLADVVRTLRDRGVEVIVLKGPTVAHSVYDRPELRIYHDLDLLCRVADYPSLHAALSARGYTSAGTLEVRGTHEKLWEKPSPSESHSVRGFYDPSGDVKIEVHFDALQLGLRDRHEEQFRLQSRGLQVGGLEIRVLSPEHQFLHLAVHAHRHCYSRLSWLVELDLMMRGRSGRIDWGVVTQVAHGEGVGAALRHAVATTRAVLDTPLPALPPPTLEERCLSACYQALLPFSRARSLNQHEHHRLHHFLPDDADLRNVLYGLVLVGRRREKLRALRRRGWPVARRR